MKKFYLVIYLALFLVNISFTQDGLSIRKNSESTDIHNEYGAIIVKGRLIFCSDKPSYGNVQYKSTNGTPFFDFIETNQFDSLKRVKSLKIEENFNSKYSEGNVTLDSSGTIAIFTRTYIPLNKKGKKKGDATLTLFQSIRENGNWTEPKPIFLPKEGSIFAQPALSPDGKTLYFVSNKNGNPDIFWSAQNQNEWSSPQVLDNNLNSSAKELFPNVAENGDIYFSSNRKGSLGGLDIFVARKNGDSFRKPVRLDSPINSSSDDYCYFKDSKTDLIYFSSNRDGTDDIFETFIPEIKLDCKPIPKKERCFVFYEDNLDALALDSVPMKFQWDVGDGTFYDGLEADHCYKDTGNYTVSLNIIDTLFDEIFYNEAVFPFELKDKQAIYIETPDTVVVNQEILLEFPYYTISKFDSITPIWDFDNGKKIEANSTKLKYTYPGSYKLKASYGIGDQGICNFKKIVVIKEENL